LPVTCQLKESEGLAYCTTDCPAEAEGGVFHYSRVERDGATPPADDHVIDVAVLDMHHGFPNLGHDCVVRDLLDATCDMQPALQRAGLSVRVLSFDVRRGLALPEAPGERFSLYVGTGGPGHLDPRRNDGVSAWSQGVRENPAWEAPYFALLDAIAADDDAAFLGICHSFGMLCRWSGAAVPSLRNDGKGGKSAGLLENWLTDAGVEDPWFRRFSAELPDGRRHRILDSRLFDLLPASPASAFAVLAVEDNGGRPGEAVTLMEFARDRGGVMPRILGANHHPEIVGRERQRQVLERKFSRGEVSAEWYQERLDGLTAVYADENSDERSHLTSDFTLLLPMRFHLMKQVRLRAERLGETVGFHENNIVELVKTSTFA
jgi:hypothetical protein